MKIKKFLFAFVVMILSGLFAFGQQANKKAAMHKKVQQHTDAIFDELVEVRRDFHVHPEVSGQEERTSQKIADYLLSLGLDVKTDIGGYGVVGILKGDNEGKAVAWRADIDAMASDIPDVVDFPSVNKGVRHICGHDVHTTVGLGIANVLSQQQEDLEGTVYFIFQPAEETYEGAKAMIDDGLWDIAHLDEIYGLHISPFPVGTVATKSGSVFAHTNRIKIVYKDPDNEESKIDFTKNLISGFQNVAADSKFWDWENLGDPEIGIENPNTIFTDFLTVRNKFGVEKTDDRVIITATLNSSDKEQLNSFLKTLKQKIENSQYSEDLVSTEYSYEKAVVVNDEELTNGSMNSISEIYGKNSVIPLYGVVTADRGDDFAYFQQQVPGVYYFLGGANYETGVISMPHSPDFAVDEESIRFGVNYFSSVLIDRLNDH
ncbi:M20 metallopeptidase family protein [Salinimicrobium terrae]|uniref:M20 metallopeptidase family protein n=1 Tax=Salinimicrobium terrae TaxID=470866 RepID=UPI0004100FD6|nr:amidohydrolase [Salinimicrobium terrae]